MKKIIALIILILLVFSSISYATNTITIEDGLVVTKGGEDASVYWNEIIINYKNFITGIAALGAVTMVLLFIMAFLKLGTSVNNPSERRKAVIALATTGVAASLLGAVALITGLFYKIII